MSLSHLDEREASLRAELEASQMLQRENAAHVQSVFKRVFEDSTAALENFHRSIENNGIEQSLEVMERGGVFDPWTKKWMGLTATMGKIRGANAEERYQAEQGLFDVRDSFMALQQQARQSDKLERSLELIVGEKRRLATELQRLKSYPASANTRVQSENDRASNDAQNTNLIDGRSLGRKSRGA